MLHGQIGTFHLWRYQTAGAANGAVDWVKAVAILMIKLGTAGTTILIAQFALIYFC
jgi:hypothetical protein